MRRWRGKRKHLWQLRSRARLSAVTFHDGPLELAAFPPAANDTLAFHIVMKNLLLFWERTWSFSICSANEAFVSQTEESISNLSQMQAGSAFGLKSAHGNDHTM